MADARRSSSSSSATPSIGSLPVLGLALSIVGLILGSVVLFIHQQLAASQGSYTSFCDISEGMSCDVVLGSSYAAFLGLPVGGWALLGYAASAGLSIGLMRASCERRFPVATALLALTGAMLVVSVYFFAISTFVLGVFCPMCLSMDAVNVGLFGAGLATFRLAAHQDRSGFSPKWPLVVAGVATLGAVVLLTLVQGSTGSDGPITVESIKRNDPRFYAYYVSQPIVTPPLGDRNLGSELAPITIVEFSDYECPYCRRAFFDLSSVLAEGSDDVRVIHRNFPLNSDCNPGIKVSSHAMACEAAIASECANRQGKETAFSRLLFANQGDVSSDDLESFASQVGLDLDEFRRCLKAPETAAAVTKDAEDGIEAGVESTPTLFINGRRIKGGFSRLEQYRYALAIERARLARQAGATAQP